jgi:hypothetical protein
MNFPFGISMADTKLPYCDHAVMKKHMLVKKLDSHETIFYFLSVVNPPMRRVEPDTSAVCSRFFGLAKKHREAPGTTI